MEAPFFDRRKQAVLFAAGVVLIALLVVHCGGSGSSGTTDVCAGAPCEDRNECTADECDADTGMCHFVVLEDGSRCGEGVCWDGMCQPLGSHWPCTSRGVESAIEEGGGPFTFACDGPTTIFVDGEIRIEHDVELDGEGNLELHGGGRDRVFHVLRGVTVELRGLSISGGSPPTDAVAPSFGGAIWNEGGSVTIVGSTLYGNAADVGAGILNAGGLSIVSSTLSGNTATIGGGAIFDVSGVSLTHTTISNNVADRGSAISSGALVSVQTTIIDGACIVEALSSGGYNIESPGDTCGLGRPSDRIEVQADQLALGTLSIGGGVLRTHEPASGSVAIDAIPPEACSSDIDELGVPRPQGSGCDIGAVERVSDL